MNDNEVNKIIAEFYKHRKKSSKQYTESLDALVPVWEKLGTNKHIHLFINSYKKGATCHRFSAMLDGKVKGESTIQQAAAHATALAILELSPKRVEHEI